MSALEGEKTYQSSLVFLPSVLAPGHTFPSIPVQVCQQSSSPPRHILSALDPGYDDDDDDKFDEYIRSRTISVRLGRALRKSSSSLWSCPG